MNRRPLSMILSVGLALAALLLLKALAEAAALRAAPAAPPLTVAVNSSLDQPDFAPGNNLCETATGNNVCTLRAAVQELDAQTNGGTINLPAGIYTLTRDVAGDLQLQKNIILTGAGPSLSIIQGNPAGWAHRILRVQDGAHTLVSGVAISGGHPVGFNGGGIYVVTGTLTLSNTVVFSNTSDADGGGIYNTGQLTIISSTIQGNTAAVDGGGIANEAQDLTISPGAQLTVTDSAILSNTAEFSGGGVFYVDTSANSPHGSMQTYNTTVSGNQANLIEGGGVYQVYGTATIIFSVLKLNSAGGGGGLASIHGTTYLLGSFVQSNTTTIADGGGLEGLGASLHVLGSTVAGNASTQGGGIASLDSLLDLEYGNVAGNTSAQGGGGLYVSGGSAAVTGTLISLNQAPAGGAGIYNSGGVITSSYNTITGNTTAAAVQSPGVGRPAVLGPGGGIYNEPASTFFARQVQLVSNTSSGTGGGAVNYGRMSLISSTVSGNVAANGAGLYNTVTGTLYVTASTLSNNQALSAAGGGLSNYGATAYTWLANSTISGNRSATDGGGLSAEQGNIYLNSVTVAGNTADSDSSGTGDGGGLFAASVSQIVLENTLVGLNTDTGGQKPDCAGSLVSTGYNLLQNPATCTLTGDLLHNVTGQDPALWLLANYGGPTDTRALLVGSPAIDKGDPTGCHDDAGHLLSTDQRGLLRSFDGNQDGVVHCDIGAYELQLSARLFLPLVRR